MYFILSSLVRKSQCRIYLLLIFLFLGAPVYAQGIRYRVEFNGIENNELLERISELSKTLDLSEQPAESITLLKKRAKKDAELFDRLLKAEGYFRTEISEEIKQDMNPVLLSFHFDGNTRFAIGSVNISFSDSEGHELPEKPDQSKTGIIPGEPFRSENILEGQEKIISFVKKQGFPFVRIEKRKITADHETRTVTVSFRINQGPNACFGGINFEGIENVEESFLKKLVPWQRGDVYDPELLNRLYVDFMDLGLFSMVRITEGTGLADGCLPVTVTVNERAHRTFSAGVRYHTDEGPGVRLRWEHRNLFRHGERLGFGFEAASYLLMAEGNFRKPFFLRNDQALRLVLATSREDPDAYTSDSLESAVLIDRELTGKIDAGTGLSFRSSRIAQLGDEESFRLLSLPSYIKMDQSNDLLDPQKGFRASLQYTPFFEFSGESLFFHRGLINYRHYLKIADSPRSVLAGRITLGMLKGAARDQIPADERLYAGGGGSVRGYPYQTVGPVSGTTPLGGKSLMELSFEARISISQKLGLALFADGGSAFSEKLFESGERLRWGAGAGIQYFTPVGPLRLDVAVPLNRRNEIDDSFQVYISLGQAF